MKKIDEYLDKFTKNLDYDGLIDRFMNDPTTKKFILDHDLTRDQIIKSSHVFLTYFEERDICKACKSLKNCGQKTVGYIPHLTFYNNRIQIEYQRCQYNQNQSTSNIHALYMPKKIFQSSLEDMDLIGESRKTIHRYILKFIKHNHRKEFMKGMYISGKYGSGKTYILAALANELARQDYKIIFAYYPDLTRELKSSIGKGDLEEKIQSLKTIDILFLDDFGGEYFSKFIRDEVLGSILQHRLLDNKPTFFSSNFPVQELVNVNKDNNSQQETVSALRIVQRIKRMTEEFVLIDMPRIS
ncbi:MAG TPA: primosomal protein DnaI [Candidatus Izemoplasmatales bacterium]|nr:primosomal protein DnaI [Candidatus Izemoplasmatales bacterium]